MEVSYKFIKTGGYSGIVCTSIIFELISSPKPTGFTSSVIFDGIEEALKNDGKNLVNKVKGIFSFKVKKPDGKS